MSHQKSQVAPRVQFLEYRWSNKPSEIVHRLCIVRLAPLPEEGANVARQYIAADGFDRSIINRNHRGPDYRFTRRIGHLHIHGSFIARTILGLVEFRSHLKHSAFRWNENLPGRMMDATFIHSHGFDKEVRLICLINRDFHNLGTTLQLDHLRRWINTVLWLHEQQHCGVFSVGIDLQRHFWPGL